MTELEKQVRLADPFPEGDIEWRISRSGKSGSRTWAFVLAYITSRAIQERLDEVFGIFGWKNEYKPGPNGGVICGISVRDVSTGEWVQKWDGAENTAIEEVKGGLSSAMKRAGVHFGIGRYLYNLTENFATCADKKSAQTPYRAKLKDGTVFWWGPPKLPAWALPKRGVGNVAQEEEAISPESAEAQPEETPVVREMEDSKATEAAPTIEVNEEGKPLPRPARSQVSQMMILAGRVGKDAEVRAWYASDSPTAPRVEKMIKKLEEMAHGSAEQ